MADTERCFEVRGKVQNVMFRQTLIRAVQKRGLVGGASNDRADKGLVRVTLRGSADDVDALVALVALVASGKQLNDWGARAESVQEVDEARGRRLDEHQVTTDNVDAHRWNPNVTMFV